MKFPEIAPSRSECQRRVAEALKSERARIYIDASVLIHCYEMSRSACDELLSAMETFGARLRIPNWSAKETWEHTRGLPSKRPLVKTVSQLSKRVGDFRNQSLRYLDERTFPDMSVDQYARKVDTAVENLMALARKVEKIEPGHDAANARLLPFLAERAMSSDLGEIYLEIQRTAETRFSHEVPPGFGDGGTRAGFDNEIDTDSDDPAAGFKGKKKNRYGDLIMWLESLTDCRETGGDHLVVITRDNTKKDWVYNPERVTLDDGTVTTNGGLITLPLPMLEQEARQRCPGLSGLHVISLEMFTQTMRTTFGSRVGNLARALQSSSKSSRPVVPLDRAPERQGADGVDHVTFSSRDMMFEAPADQAGDRVWQLLKDLKGDGWDLQNEAATELVGLLYTANDDQLKQAGRALVDASNEDALGPIELAVELIGPSDLAPKARANLLIGMLGECYFDANGEPKKPSAHSDIVAALFDSPRDEAVSRAIRVAVTEPLGPARKMYLALPDEPQRNIRLEIQQERNVLKGVQADGRELLETDAPPLRQLALVGGVVSVTDLVSLISKEFVVPADMIKVEGPSNYEITVPERMGFVAWGPATGEQLR